MATTVTTHINGIDLTKYNLVVSVCVFACVKKKKKKLLPFEVRDAALIPPKLFKLTLTIIFMEGGEKKEKINENLP